MTRWSASQGTAFTLIAGLALTVPWLNPFAPGPSPALVPWLVVLVATACLLLSTALHAVPRKAMGNGSFAQRWAYPAAWAWMLAGMASSVIGLLQYFGATTAFVPLINQAPLGEAFANLRQRNQFASLTNIALVALIWLGVKNCFGRHRQWWVWTAAGLLAMGNAASASRTGLVQLGLLCALFWVWGGLKQSLVRRVLMTAVLAYGLATLALPWLAGLEPGGHGMFGRLRANDAICASRLTLWSNVLQLIAQKPWLGWGWGELDYAHYMTHYPGTRFCDILDNAHNLPLHLAVELGIPAALLACGTAAWLIVRARPWRETDPTRQMAWSVLALILLHCMLEYPLWYGPFQMAFGLCVGLLWAAPARADTALQPAGKLRLNRPIALYLWASIAMISIAFVAYAGFDYYRVSQIYLAPDARNPAYRDDTLNKIRGTRLFGNQVRFAELSITPLTSANAAQMYALSSELLHYSPEPRVIEKVIESAAMLGRDDEALVHLARYRAAFPEGHAKWVQANALVAERLQRLN